MASKTIEDYKRDYEAARAAGDAAGMKAANDGANAIRASMGVAAEYATEDIAKVAAQSSGSTAQNTTQPSVQTGGSAAQVANTEKTAPAGYTGSAQNVSTYNQDQEAIRAQMNANSQAWYGASAEEQARLHAENEYLATLLGSGVSFDPDSGTWSGNAQQPVQQTVQQPVQQEPVQTPDTPTLAENVNDYSNYLEEMYAAQKRQALAELNAAYEKNVNALDRAGEGLSEQYQAARNSTTGASELSKRNFAEYAAANGLNSGAGGQAELARNVTLQNNLNSIDTAEADTIADLELQRANAETDYNNAIAQAEASGDYELAAALYQEKVRYDNAMIEAIQQEYQNALSKYQLDYQAQRDQVSDSQWAQQFGFQQQQYNDSQQQYNDGLIQTQQDTLASYGKAFLQQGVMPSAEMLAAMGITTQDAQNYIASVQAQKVAAASSSPGSTMTLTTAKQYASNGIFNDDVLATFYKNGWNDDLLAVEYGYTGNETPAASYNNGSLTTDQVKTLQASLGVQQDGYYSTATQKAANGMTADQAWSNYWSVVNELSQIESAGINVNSKAVQAIQKANESGKITDTQAKALLAQYGF